MAMGLGNGNGGRGRRYRPLSEINVTPLVDVMLVLLIIFMVTAPLMTSSVNVNLPKADATPTETDSKPLNISVDAQGNIFLQDQPVSLDDLVGKLTAIAPTARDQRIFVRGDQANAYGRIIQVLGVIIQGGFTKVALLTDPSGAATPATGARATPGATPAPAVPSTAAPQPASK
jgi:biopolymer transport protein TolR